MKLLTQFAMIGLALEAAAQVAPFDLLSLAITNGDVLTPLTATNSNKLYLLTNSPKLDPVTNRPKLYPVTNQAKLYPVTNHPRLYPVTNQVKLYPVTNHPKLYPVTNRPTMHPVTSTNHNNSSKVPNTGVGRSTQPVSPALATPQPQNRSQPASKQRAKKVSIP